MFIFTTHNIEIDVIEWSSYECRPRCYRNACIISEWYILGNQSNDYDVKLNEGKNAEGAENIKTHFIHLKFYTFYDIFCFNTHFIYLCFISLLVNQTVKDRLFRARKFKFFISFSFCSHSRRHRHRLRYSTAPSLFWNINISGLVLGEDRAEGRG